MITRYDAAIGGTWLSEISDSILVTDIREDPAKTKTVTAEKAVSSGMRFVRQLRQSLSVTVLFVIWEQDVERRKEILQRVQAWTAGTPDGPARLEVNDRRGQRLLVRCTQLPVVSSALNWQEEFQAVFTAYELPFWMDDEYSRATITSSGSLFVPGVGETLVDVDVTNNGNSAITALTLACGDTSFAFSGISLAKGQTLSISHDERGLLSIKIGSTSVMPNRTADSDDELVAMCGAYNIIAVSGGNVSAVFKARGVYL